MHCQSKRLKKQCLTTEQLSLVVREGILIYVTGNSHGKYENKLVRLAQENCQRSCKNSGIGEIPVTINFQNHIGSFRIICLCMMGRKTHKISLFKYPGSFSNPAQKRL